MSLQKKRIERYYNRAHSCLKIAKELSNKFKVKDANCYIDDARYWQSRAAEEVAYSAFKGDLSEIYIQNRIDENRNITKKVGEATKILLSAVRANKIIFLEEFA
jgi:sulfur relay (sulfurtransferase) DsrC/TusE family protein